MKRFSLCVVLSALVAIGAFAGGGQEAEAPDEGGEFDWVIESGDFVEVNALEVEGNIIAAGSSTVFPAAEYLANKFNDEGYGGTITVDSIGSGAGFERFIAGESDISTASRPIRDSEVEAARENGRDPLEFLLGMDALAVVVHPENDWISNASVEELARIFTAERWSDVNPDWPNEPVRKFIPGTDSGTFDYFVEEVFDEDTAPLLNASDLQLSEDDNILVQGVEGSPYAVGFFGYAYYVDEAERMKVLSVEGVEASAETVDNGTYPLARPLFMYSTVDIMRSKSQVAAFLAFAVNNATEAMRAVGYFKPSADAVQNARETWRSAMQGTY